MEKYIEGNKAAWEEAFDNRTDSWGADIPERIRNEEYPFFNEETRSVLKQIRTEGDGNCSPWLKAGRQRKGSVLILRKTRWPSPIRKPGN